MTNKINQKRQSEGNNKLREENNELDSQKIIKNGQIKDFSLKKINKIAKSFQDSQRQKKLIK